MRDIKFRAWDGKEMLNREIFDRHWYNGEEKLVEQAMPSDRHKYDIMQYTGVKDINGVEIYEGDIVRYTQVLADGATKKGRVSEVKWLFGKRRIGFNIGKNANMTVIGNIYENPELLK